jgi:hypothetical protein
MGFIKSLPWWVWIIAIVGVVIIWQGLSGWSTSRKLYNMMLGDIKKDESQVIKEKDAWIKTCEDEILQIKEEKDKIAQEKIIAQKDAANSKAKVARLEGENDALRIKIRNVVVPDDPDRIIDGLRKRFPSIHKIQP